MRSRNTFVADESGWSVLFTKAAGGRGKTADTGGEGSSASGGGHGAGLVSDRRCAVAVDGAGSSKCGLMSSPDEYDEISVVGKRGRLSGAGPLKIMRRFASTCERRQIQQILHTKSASLEFRHIGRAICSPSPSPNVALPPPAQLQTESPLALPWKGVGPETEEAT